MSIGQESKVRPTMWERYLNRPASRPTEMMKSRLQTIHEATQLNQELLSNVLDMLTEHANIIDGTRQQLKETQHFMEWATSTHENIFKEYKSIHDIGESA